MTRQLFAAAALTALAALGVTGCNRDFVAGRCDCQYVPSNMALKLAGNPYPVIGSPSAAVPAAPNYQPAPNKGMPEVMPMTIPVAGKE
jgi:hypothetical protein